MDEASSRPGLQNASPLGHFKTIKFDTKTRSIRKKVLKILVLWDKF